MNVFSVTTTIKRRNFWYQMIDTDIANGFRAKSNEYSEHKARICDEKWKKESINHEVIINGIQYGLTKKKLFSSIFSAGLDSSLFIALGSFESFIVIFVSGSFGLVYFNKNKSSCLQDQPMAWQFWHLSNFA